MTMVKQQAGTWEKIKSRVPACCYQCSIPFTFSRSHRCAVENLPGYIETFWKLRSNARPINLLISSFFETPAASQSIGYMLMAVKPGMVLISLKITSPSWDTKKSTRARP